MAMSSIGVKRVLRLSFALVLLFTLSCHHTTEPLPLCAAARPPAISITSVPPIGSTDAVGGNVAFMTTPCSASSYRVALFILVPPYSANTYICKPVQADPLTTISDDGSWSAQYATGGLDTEATQFRAFLVTPGFNWPCFTNTLPTVDGSTVLAVARASR
jgi:hypothetical protein